MDAKKFFRSRILWFFIISAIFIAGGFFANRYFKFSAQDKKKIVENVRDKISDKEKELFKYVEDLTEKLKSNSISSIFSDKEFQFESGEGFSFLVFRNDTLRYWSDNKISCSVTYDNALFDKTCGYVGNGFYRIKKQVEKKYIVIGLYLIRTDFKYENDYLNNSFNEDLSLGKGVSIAEQRNENSIITSDGEYLFSLDFKKNIPLTEGRAIILFILYLTGFLFFVAGIFYIHKWLYSQYKSRLLYIGGFIADILILRFLLFYFRIPADLYSTEIFSPLQYAAHELLPSFGDLLLNALVVLIAAFAFYRGYKPGNDIKFRQNRIVRYLFAGLLMVVSAVLFRAMLILLKSMVVDSTITYTLNNIFNLDFFSLLGFIVMAMLILSFVLINDRLSSIAFKMVEKTNGFIYSTCIAFAVIIVLYFSTGFFTPLSLTGIAVYMTGMWLFRSRPDYPNLFSRLLFGLCFFSLVATQILYVNNNYKEREKRKSLAQKLAESQDPVAEYLYGKIGRKLADDTLLKERIKKYPEKQETIPEYIQKTYFTGYWDKYKIQITTCTDKDSLSIPPSFSASHCKTYFGKQIAEYGRLTSAENLYMLNFGTGGNSYIARLEFPIDSTASLDIYIELNSKFINKGMGYPELLIDKKVFLNTDLSNYSYARYRNKELIDAYGKYYYSICRDHRDTLETSLGFYDRNRYNHLYYRIDKNSELIISKKSGTWLEIVAPFSLLFLFFAVFLFLFFVIVRIPYGFDRINLNFKNRLQISMVSIILISFVLIGVSMSFYIRKLNEKKNLENLSEKTLSILIEVQGKFSSYDSLSPGFENYVSNYLQKFSEVFFSDINLFDLSGDLISSSRPQIFEEGLVSYKMNPVAYNELAINHKTIFIHKEKIGGLEFYSAYMPFYNEKNKLVAFLNLPYFAKENELKLELSDFMMTFINIYVFLIGIAVIVALIIAGRMTRPLKEIRDKIGRVQLGGKNEKIIWKRRDDEIGNLVNEYNRMIDELSLSAELLAKSERESAWREMAKQVAHEIKNPLTPMKLSVQYLEKAWNDKAPDWEARLKKFTNTLIEQIDSLSAIASAFSDFAKMPRSEMKKIDLAEVINTAISTFPGDLHTIEFECQKEQDHRVLADKKQIIRALNNLITNAIQAIGNQQDGHILIRLLRMADRFEVSVKDNGPGIADEQKPRIFMPNFSTKSEGMGLGLAMVKSIIEGHGGTIWFESGAGEGVTFYFELPLPENNTK